MWYHLKMAHQIHNPESKYSTHSFGKMSERQNTIDNMFQSKNSYESSSKKAIEITKLLAVFLVKDMRPIELIESKHFQAFCKALDPR